MPISAIRPFSHPVRYDRLDALRGFAMVWMAIYHFGFDLNHFGLIKQDFYRDPVWTLQRTAILSIFLFSAGVGLAVAMQQGQSWRRFWRRWLQIAGGALLVSVGSYWMFPRSFIFFGVLHGIALMLLITRLVTRSDVDWRWLWLGGTLLIALPWLFGHPFFDTRLTAWVGLITRKPITEDFVPLLPWMGVMWWGMAAGRWMLQQRPDSLAGPLPEQGRAVLGSLAWLGRWSLSFYLLHQPVLIGILFALRAAGLI